MTSTQAAAPAAVVPAVKQAALQLPPLAPAVKSLEQTKAAVLEFFGKDADVSQVEQLFQSLQVSVHTKALSRLPDEMTVSANATALKQVADDLKALGEPLKAKYEAYAKATDSETKQRFKQELKDGFEAAKSSYAALAVRGKELLELVVPEWKKFKQANAHKTLQVTIAEANSLKDAATKDKITSEVIEGYTKRQAQNVGVETTLRAYRQAFFTYLELSAMVLTMVGVGIVEETAVASVGMVRSAVNAVYNAASFVGSYWQSAQVYSKHAPDPWNGTPPPNFI